MSVPTPDPTRRRVRAALLAVIALLLLAGTAACIWWFTRTPPAAVPPVPAELADDEVRQVIEAARAKVAESPRSAGAWGELGLTFFANLFDREADRCFEEAARLDPADVRWPYARGVIATKRDPGNAVPLLRQAAAGTTPGAEYRAAARMALAEALLEARQLDEAEKLFRGDLEQPSYRERATLGLGLVARARGDAASAEKYLTEARASPRTRKQATIQLAALVRARGDAAGAAALEKEAAAMPGDQGWPDPMLDELSRLRVGRRARERTSHELEDEGRYEEAAFAYLREVEQRPTVQASCGAAVNFARVGEYDRALDLLRDAIRLDAENSQAHYTVAVVQFTRAEKERVRSPGSAEAAGWLREAVLGARRATELKPDHAQAYRLWGQSLMLLGEPAAAVQPLTKGVACRPESMPLQLALGEALRDSGKTAEAVARFEEARKLDPNDPRPAQALEKLRGKK